MTEEFEDIPRCANCGVADGNGIKLKTCTACKSVKYCGVKCQKEHRPKQKKECKKRAAELKDEILFKQPEGSYLGDCPICFLPLPLDEGKAAMSYCCCKTICLGCVAAEQREAEEKKKPALNCAFCRQPVVYTKEESDKRLHDRAKLNDPAAIRELGKLSRNRGDYKSAYAEFSSAADLGDTCAQYELSSLYRDGNGVREDHKMELYYLEQAALGGDPLARDELGICEWNNGRHERAIKHWFIGAKLGHDHSLEQLKQAYEEGFLSKDDFAAALRSHQDAIDATKSPLRQEAEEEYAQIDISGTDWSPL